MLLFFLSLLNLNAQSTEFTISDEGLTKYIITSIPGVNKADAYKKTINWINKKFNSPDQVIKGTIENEYIRFEGISNNALRFQAIGGIIAQSIKYQIEISFKDDKYKFEVIELQEEDPLFPKLSNSPYTELILSKTNRSNGYNRVRKPNGEFRNRYKYITDIPFLFNQLNTSLKDYITSSQENDNW